MTLTPVSSASSTMHERVSTLRSVIASSMKRPNASSPTTPTNAVRRPSRAAAHAMIAEEEPIVRSAASTIFSVWPKRGTTSSPRRTRSGLISPTTRRSYALIARSSVRARPSARPVGLPGPAEEANVPLHLDRHPLARRRQVAARAVRVAIGQRLASPARERERQRGGDVDLGDAAGDGVDELVVGNAGGAVQDEGVRHGVGDEPQPIQVEVRFLACLLVLCADVDRERVAG